MTYCVLILSSLFLMASAFANEAVSAAFRLDLRIESSADHQLECGLTEVWGVSDRWISITMRIDPDVNCDGIPDWWEQKYGCAIGCLSAEGDNDGDGQSNLAEYNAGTNPLIPDDWMTLSAVNVAPFTVDTHTDATDDQPPSFDDVFTVLKTSNEFVCDTGGFCLDWDDDGIPNWWEKRFSQDGSKTGIVSDKDDDQDGMSNYAEFIAYTNPTNRQSRFDIFCKFTRHGTDANGFSVSWESAKGRIYKVWTSSDLSNGWDVEPYAILNLNSAVG